MTLPNYLTSYIYKRGGLGGDRRDSEALYKVSPSLPIVLEEKKLHNNTKYWAFTWGTTVTQKKLPGEKKLKNFLNRITETCMIS